MNVGHVYFIQIGSGGPIKIGHTVRSVAVRYREICAKYPWLEVKFLGKLPGAQKREKRVQDIFKKYMIVPEIIPEGVQVIKDTEIFWPAEPLLAYIGRLRDKSLF